MSSLKKEERWEKVRNLTIKEIDEFAKREGVKKVAVENFLMSMGMNDKEKFIRGNLFRDAQMYKWNKKTIIAISDGIKSARE